MKEKLYLFVSKRLFLLTYAVLFALLTSQLLGSAVWQLELFSHYVPHVAILTWCAWLIYPRQYSQLLRWCFFIVAASLTLWCFSPLSILKQYLVTERFAHDDTPSLIAYQNVEVSNPNPQQTIEQLLQYDPDIILLVEAGGERWNAELARLHKSYPVYCGDKQNSPFAMQVFIKSEQTQCTLSTVAYFPVITVTQANNKVLYGIHPPPPINASLAAAQQRFLSEFENMLNTKQKSKQKTTVVGDINLSAFSPTYRRFFAHSDLQRTTLNGLPTWLPFGLGIDHVFTNDTPDNLSVQPLQWNGSDHRGFLIRWH